MKSVNILSICQGICALDNESKYSQKDIKGLLKFSPAEAKTLNQFCSLLKHDNAPFKIYENFFVGYSIKQISKEFDLLRFSDTSIINIELKGELNLEFDKKITKIKKQMKQNYYYLKFIKKKIYIYTFVENDQLYKYDVKDDKVVEADFKELINILKKQSIDNIIDPDNLFLPSNYLVSPFNKTETFMNNEYFLTDNQQRIKNSIFYFRMIKNKPYINPNVKIFMI